MAKTKKQLVRNACDCCAQVEAFANELKKEIEKEISKNFKAFPGWGKENDNLELFKDIIDKVLEKLKKRE